VWFTYMYTYIELNYIAATQPGSFFRIAADIYIHGNIVR